MLLCHDTESRPMTKPIERKLRLLYLNELENFALALFGFQSCGFELKPQVSPAHGYESLKLKLPLLE